MNHSLSFTVNGVRRDVALSDPRVTLLDLLREQLDLTGTKKRCDRGQCGTCTVVVNGRRINSCLALPISHDGADITTIEGLARGEELHPLQVAFITHDGFQCGFCTPRQIVSALGLINEHPRRHEQESLPLWRLCGDHGSGAGGTEESRRGEAKAGRMKSFDYVRPASVVEAIAAASLPRAAYLAAGTNLLD